MNQNSYTSASFFNTTSALSSNVIIIDVMGV
jgi:hypothetical protein